MLSPEPQDQHRDHNHEHDCHGVVLVNVAHDSSMSPIPLDASGEGGGITEFSESLCSNDRGGISRNALDLAYSVQSL